MKEFWDKAKRNRTFIISLIALIVLILIAALGERFLVNDPYEENFYSMLSAPSREYFFGTVEAYRKSEYGRLFLAR